MLSRRSEEQARESLAGAAVWGLITPPKEAEEVARVVVRGWVTTLSKRLPTSIVVLNLGLSVGLSGLQRGQERLVETLLLDLTPRPAGRLWRHANGFLEVHAVPPFPQAATLALLAQRWQAGTSVHLCANETDRSPAFSGLQRVEFGFAVDADGWRQGAVDDVLASLIGQPPRQGRYPVSPRTNGLGPVGRHERPVSLLRTPGPD